ncbi:unnamed protein product [Phytomonas sp. Hart1]|nr:unnamed protein product [Phytomonas sp. Hart1]|eukprot:CCW71911.1 unnamed protein product [Phytomonas sp. isolate Hart1]
MKEARRGRGQPTTRKSQETAHIHEAGKFISNARSPSENDSSLKCFQLKIVNSCVCNADIMLPRRPQRTVFAPFYTRAWSSAMETPPLDHQCEGGDVNTNPDIGFENARKRAREAPPSSPNIASSGKHQGKGARGRFFERTRVWQWDENDDMRSNPSPRKNEKVLVREGELSAEQWMGHIAHVILGRHSQLSSSSSLYYRLRHPCISRMQARIVFITCADMHTYFIQRFPSIIEEETKSNEEGGMVYVIREDEGAASLEPLSPMEGSLNEGTPSPAQEKYTKCAKSFKGAYYLLINYGSNPIFVNTQAVPAGRSVALTEGDIISFLECAFDGDAGVVSRLGKESEEETNNESVDVDDPQQSLKLPPLKPVEMGKEEFEMSFEGNDCLVSLQGRALEALLAHHAKKGFDALDYCPFAAGISREKGENFPGWRFPRMLALPRRGLTSTRELGLDNVFEVCPQIQAYFCSWLRRQGKMWGRQEANEKKNDSEERPGEARIGENGPHDVASIPSMKELSYDACLRYGKQIEEGLEGYFRAFVEGVSASAFSSEDEEENVEEVEAEGIVLSPLRGRLVLQAKPQRQRGNLLAIRTNEKETEKEASSMSPIKELLLQLLNTQKEEKKNPRMENNTQKLRLISPLNERGQTAAAEPMGRLSRFKTNSNAAEPPFGKDDDDNEGYSAANHHDNYEEDSPMSEGSPYGKWPSNAPSGFPSSSSSLGHYFSSSEGLFPSGIPRISIQPAVLPVFVFMERSRSPERTTHEAPSCREILRTRNGDKSEDAGHSPRYVYYYEEDAIEEKGKKRLERTRPPPPRFLGA